MFDMVSIIMTTDTENVLGVLLALIHSLKDPPQTSSKTNGNNFVSDKGNAQKLNYLVKLVIVLPHWKKNP